MSSDIKPQKGIQKVSRRCQETFSSESALSAGAEGCFWCFYGTIILWEGVYFNKFYKDFVIGLKICLNLYTKCINVHRFINFQNASCQETNRTG